MSTMTQRNRIALIGLISLLVGACGDGDELPELPSRDSGMMDAGPWDAGPLDARIEGGGRDGG